MRWAVPAALAALAAVPLVLAGVPGGAGEGRTPRLPGAPNCPIFPASSHWNMRVDQLPLHPRSAAMVSAVGRSAPAHAGFASGLYEGEPIGIPYRVVSSTQKRVPMRFKYHHSSDPGPYPIPANMAIQGGRSSEGDRHLIVVDRDRCRLYELYAAYPQNGGRSWRAGSGATWNLRSNRLRPRFWTSADAAGLPILPGLVRYDEVRSGRIDHALRITVPRTRRAFIYPARHFASHSRDPDLPAMGQRVRLRASFDVSGYPPQSQVVLSALKRYGALVADNGSAWNVSGAPSDGWDNDDLHSFTQVQGSDFEVVDTRRLPRP